MAWKNVQYENGKYRTGSSGGGSSTFADLEDVDLSNLQDGQVPKYNSSTQKWENANESGGSGHNYSTTEQVIGTWIDGKPLYEIVLSCNFTESYYDFTIDATFQIKLFHGIVYASSGDYNFIHLGYGNISSDMVQAYQYSSTKIRVQNSFYGTRNVGEFILQYIKTTD